MCSHSVPLNSKTISLHTWSFRYAAWLWNIHNNDGRIEFTNWKVWHRREAVVQEAHVGVALDIALVTVLGVTVPEELALEVRTSRMCWSIVYQHFPTEMGWTRSWIRSQKLCEAAQKLYTRGERIKLMGTAHGECASVPPKNVMDFQREKPLG